MKFSFKVGDIVYSQLDNELAKVLQKRIENGHLCYYLDNGAIRNQTLLTAIK
jgi:hypothetical protein